MVSAAAPSQQVAAGSEFAATRLSDVAGRLLSEIYTAGPLAGPTVSNAYDGLGRRTMNGLWNGAAWLVQTFFGYDAASRLAGVTNGVYSATYSYLANAPLVAQICFRSNDVIVMTTTNQYDNRNRLTTVASWAGGVCVARSAYGYNLTDQRVALTNADNTYWLYGYDALGQVTSGKKYWPDGTPVLGQQFEYSFDDIGNRKVAVTGGNQWGSNKRYQNYAANLLNQYTSRTVPGYVDIVGAAASNATVTVNLQPAERQGEYFRAELAVNNSAGPVWLAVTNAAVLQQGTNPDLVTNWVGNLFLPQTPEQFLHDADGNLTNDGRWIYTWDAENRLIKLESLANAPSGSKRRLEFECDGQGRRIKKKVTDLETSAVLLENKLLYDNWNLIAELNATNNNLIRSYMWGPDLSGTLQGAGGVGGLLAAVQNGETYFACGDGNGNITDYMDTNGTVVAHREYDPFGGTIALTGSKKDDFSFWFSTKYTDKETGLVYFGYRSYSPTLGRWLSRDMLREEGFGVSQKKDSAALFEATLSQGEGAAALLYVFLHNQPVNRVDPFGLEECKKCGREIDLALVATKADVVSRFNGLGAWRQFVNCRPWKYPGFAGAIDLIRAATGWDMDSPTWAWNTTCGPGSGVPCGIPRDCQDSVWVERGCYWKWDVNYLLFGWMSDLCGIPAAQMQAEVIAWKTAKGEPWAQALAFAQAGRAGYPYPTTATIPTPPAKYKDCKNCGFVVWGGIFSDLASRWPHASWWF